MDAENVLAALRQVQGQIEAAMRTCARIEIEFMKAKEANERVGLIWRDHERITSDNS